MRKNSKKKAPKGRNVPSAQKMEMSQKQLMIARQMLRLVKKFVSDIEREKMTDSKCKIRLAQFDRLSALIAK